MNAKNNVFIALLSGIALFFTVAWTSFAEKAPASKNSTLPNGRYLFVAVPGIRDYLGYGGHGLLVFDMNNNHRFVKRIETQGYHPNKKPSNVKGIAVSIPLNSIYITTLESLQRIDLTSGKIIWENKLKAVPIDWLSRQTEK